MVILFCSLKFLDLKVLTNRVLAGNAVKIRDGRAAVIVRAELISVIPSVLSTARKSGKELPGSTRVRIPVL